MPPKLINSNKIKIVYMRCTVGPVGATSALTPKIRPLSLSLKKIGDDIAKATGDWKGLKITVKLPIVVVPCVSAFIVKALNLKHSANIILDEIVNVASIIRPCSIAKELSGNIKEILGIAQSVACTIDGNPLTSISVTSS
uniref:Large ribosomal subunit protein uL11 N-terminal domain-containing protein n=1 Tax=Gouania willdenowi TaxID=441366 RepID=A0A8C5HBJ8_GOUWI